MNLTKREALNQWGKLTDEKRSELIYKIMKKGFEEKMEKLKNAE